MPCGHSAILLLGFILPFTNFIDCEIENLQIWGIEPFTLYKLLVLVLEHSASATMSGYRDWTDSNKILQKKERKKLIKEHFLSLMMFRFVQSHN